MSDLTVKHEENLELSIQNLKEYINPKATDRELVVFKELCIARNLNPWIGEAYLVKYGDAPAQMIVSEAAFNKRIQSVPNFIGIKDGVIVQDKDGKLSNLEGEFYTDSQKLVGAWAQVFIEGKEFGLVKVRIEDYEKGQATWKNMRARMIVKCARVAAMRRACPEEFSGLYTDAEVPLIKANSKRTSFSGPDEINIGPISPDQLKELKQAVILSKKPERDICVAMKIGSLDELSENKFEKVMARLKEIQNENS